ncbi:MAG: cation transporter [Pseudomonadota bacterium]
MPKISCLSCILHIKDSIRELPGYINSRMDLASRRVVIAYDPRVIEPEYFRTAINALGYQVEGEVTPTPEISLTDDRDSRKGSSIFGPIAIGLMAAAAVFAFYLGLMTLTADWYYTEYQFERYQGWIIALALGLGLQAWLYSFFRQWVKGESAKTAGKGLAASGGMSTAAMAACCSHYLVAILPALGLPFLTTAVAALEEYQNFFFLLGVLSNLAGIFIMLRLFNKNGIISPRGLIGRIGLTVFGSRKYKEEET